MNLRQKLEYHYKAFDKSKISPDPLQLLHLYEDEKDIEVIGFLASIFAYGNVRQIMNTLEKLTTIFGNKPFQYITNFSKNDFKDFKGIKHRFYSGKDIVHLFSALNYTYRNYGSLKNLFLGFYNPFEPNLQNSISQFSNHCINIIQKQTPEKGISRGVKFMFPLPEKGSACKRINLFLRWMVRKDELDFGLWNEIPTNKLVIPVDTHIAKISRSLKLTKRKNVSWQMAEEITEHLKKYDSIDPIKYDFALCHIGMRKLEF